MKKIFKILLKALLAFIIAAILYFATAYILGKIPQDSIEASDGDVTLYLNSNGVHADIVMPLSDDLFYHIKITFITISDDLNPKSCRRFRLRLSTILPAPEYAAILVSPSFCGAARACCRG